MDDGTGATQTGGVATAEPAEWVRLGRILLDVTFAAACASAAVIIHLNGSEAVPANADPNALSVVFTLLSGAPLAFRRSYPLTVLAVISGALLALVLMRQAVGVSTIGLIIAFYTAVGQDSKVASRRATWLLLAVGVVTAVLRPVDLSVEGALVTSGALAFAWFLADGGRQRRDRHDAELDAERQRAELERRRAEQEHDRAEQVAVQERLRITRELHDVVGHALSVMVVQAEVAERLLDGDPGQSRAAIREVSATGRGSLTEMRRLLGLIRDGEEAGGGSAPPPREPAPTLDDLPGLAARMESAGLRVDLVRAGLGDDVPPGLQLAAYRVVQEALTNTLRHAGPTRVRVAVDRADGLLAVEVVDDGPVAGTPVVVEVPAAGGHGLQGMRERVAIYGGQLTAGPSAPRPGFRVHATFALPQVVA